MPITEKMRSRLLAYFRSEPAMLDAARQYDIEAFREAAQGAGEKRAADLISEILGVHCRGFLATEQAAQILEHIIGLVQGYAHTSYARNRLRLTGPLGDAALMEAGIEMCQRSKERVESLPRARLEALLAGLSRLAVPLPRFDSSVVLLVESEEECERVSAGGLSRYVRVLSADDPSGLEEAEVIVYVPSTGRLDITRLENVVTVPSGAKDFEMVPSVVLDFFTANRDLLATIAELRSVLGMRSVCADILGTLDRVRDRQVDFRVIEKAVLQVRDEMNAELKRHASELQLTGDEVLEVLGQGVPRKVREVFSRVLVEGRSRLAALTGYDRSPFLMKYPIEVDATELEKVRRSIMSESGTALFEEKVRAARKLKDSRQAVEAELREALELDYEFALGAFALDFGLVRPRFGQGFALEGLAHLALARQAGVQRVDYRFGGRDNAILLTGANSGGKTTLLEAVAQAVIMARCGLPVCAKTAQLEIPQELYFFSQQRNLNAGAFEGFLRTLVPAVTGNARKLILADELEAMTELEAGARIVAAMVEKVRETGSCIIVVTHMAREISRFTRVRIDGIEARGLDEDYNLIVDRTPKRDCLAKSTPELILRRLAQTSEGPQKAVYRELLDRLKD
jgi:DNA mismatch repair protein MutS2